MRKIPRIIPALMLLSMYALIVMSPLAPLALRSPVIAHAFTGECASDCSICGCSAERSANHTCCCWLKKKQVEHDNDPDEPACCKKKHATKKAVSTIRSCPCKSSNNMALIGTEQNDVLPFCFNHGNLVLREVALTTTNPDRLTSRPGDPPDPPPIVNSIS